MQYKYYLLLELEVRVKYKEKLLNNWKKGVPFFTLEPYEKKYILTMCKKDIDWGQYNKV
jgi:hypothetical protein